MLKHMLINGSQRPAAARVPPGLQHADLVTAAAVSEPRYAARTPLPIVHQHSNGAAYPNGPVLNVKVNGAPGGRLHPPLNMSSSSKYSAGGNSGSVSPGTRTTGLDHSREHSHLTDLSHLSHLSPIVAAEASRLTRKSLQGILPGLLGSRKTSPVRAALTSLALLCLTSLILALLALTFLVEVTPSSMEGGVKEVTLSLAALTLTLDLSCLLICVAQFIFAVKLSKTPSGEERAVKYLHQSSVTRVCAVTAFFLSVPTFLTGVVFYTFNHIQSSSSTSAAVPVSVFIGIGIVFCGCAMIHNILIWQKQKTKMLTSEGSPNVHIAHNGISKANSPIPNATLDLSGIAPSHELSTLV